MPGFDHDAAFRHLKRAVGLGPRPAGSPALAATRRYITGELAAASLAAREQAFIARSPAGPIHAVNLIVELPGARPEAILIGGHYDTKRLEDPAFVGANDGGSSMAFLLELARVLRDAERQFTYWLVFFDAEEAVREWRRGDGLFGSRYLVASLRADRQLSRVRAAIVVDMIAHRDLRIAREKGSSRWLTALIWNEAARLGYQPYFSDDLQAVEDDHTPFLRAGIPAALVMDGNYRSYWHTPADGLDKLSPHGLGVVGHVLLGALPELEALLAGPVSAGHR